MCGTSKVFALYLLEMSQLLTDSQQKEYSKLNEIVVKAREKLEKEQVIASAKSLTYVQQRAKKSLQFNKNRLANLEKEFEAKKLEIQQSIEAAQEVLNSKPSTVVNAEILLEQAIKKRDGFMNLLKSANPEVCMPAPTIKELTQKELDEIAEMNRKQLEQRQAPAKPKVDPKSYGISQEEMEQLRKEAEENKRQEESMKQQVESSNTSQTDPKENDWNSEDDRDGDRRVEEARERRAAKHFVQTTEPPPEFPRILSNTKTKKPVKVASGR